MIASDFNVIMFTEVLLQTVIFVMKCYVLYVIFSNFYLFMYTYLFVRQRERDAYIPNPC